MSIQYTVPGYELTTFGTWVSSHNHWTRAPIGKLLYRTFICLLTTVPIETTKIKRGVAGTGPFHF